MIRPAEPPPNALRMSAHVRVRCYSDLPSPGIATSDCTIMLTESPKLP